MSDFQNRLGHDNFVWWIGVVEDRQDPLNMGRCRVRIFGSHSENLNDIPTKSLPWATPVYPVNDSRSFGTPMEGDYVFGFFTDGVASQSPVMIGVFPGIPQENPREGVGFSSKSKFTNPAENVQNYGELVVVAPRMAACRPGEPTTPAIAYSYKGTGIEKCDQNRAHVCDIANDLRFKAAIDKIEKLGIFTTVRTTIESATSSASSSAIASQLTSAVKTIRSYVRMIKEVSDFINEIVMEIASFLQYVQKMIQWVLSLPAYLINMLKKCLAELQDALTNALKFGGASGAGSELISELKGLLKDTTSVATSLQNTAANATATLGTASAIMNPKSYSKP